MNIREALQQQAPSLALQRSAADEIARLDAEVKNAGAAFNAAINFAIEQGTEAAVFLNSWREGDTHEWPQFTANVA